MAKEFRIFKLSFFCVTWMSWKDVSLLRHTHTYSRWKAFNYFFANIKGLSSPWKWTHWSHSPCDCEELLFIKRWFSPGWLLLIKFLTHTYHMNGFELSHLKRFFLHFINSMSVARTSRRINESALWWKVKESKRSWKIIIKSLCFLLFCCDLIKFDHFYARSCTAWMYLTLNYFCSLWGVDCLKSALEQTFRGNWLISWQNS